MIDGETRKMTEPDPVNGFQKSPDLPPWIVSEATPPPAADAAPPVRAGGWDEEQLSGFRKSSATPAWITSGEPSTAAGAVPPARAEGWDQEQLSGFQRSADRSPWITSDAPPRDADAMPTVRPGDWEEGQLSGLQSSTGAAPSIMSQTPTAADVDTHGRMDGVGSARPGGREPEQVGGGGADLAGGAKPEFLDGRTQGQLSGGWAAQGSGGVPELLGGPVQEQPGREVPELLGGRVQGQPGNGVPELLGGDGPAQPGGGGTAQGDHFGAGAVAGFSKGAVPPAWITSGAPPAGDGGRAGRAGRGGRRRRVVLVGVVTLAVLGAGGAGAVAFAGRNDADANSGGVPSGVGTAAGPESTLGATPLAGGQLPDDGLTDTPLPESTLTDTEEPSSPPTEDPQDVALAELERISDADRGRVTISGQYVAQLASKNPGITDPYQKAADGSHTFRATDILAEYQELSAGPGNGSARIVLLKSTAYGKRQLYHGKPLYVTFALAGFRGAQDVTDWCAHRFPRLSGDALTNQCAVRRLRPAS
jgi:hypothetical protein